MIRILFENSIFLHQSVGGISKYITKLNDNLYKQNINSKIYAPLTINHYLRKKRKSNIFFIKFDKIPKFCRKIFFCMNNILFIFYIKFFKPDLVHFTYYNNSILKFINIPFVLTVYDLIHEKLNLKQKNFHKKNLIYNAKHIICISNQTKKDLLKYYKVDKKKVSVIYLGTDVKKSNSKEKRKKFILHVGDRGRYKNFKNFIYAFSLSRYLKENYKIVCFGGSSQTFSEKKLFKKLNIENMIEFINGDDSKLESYYKKASLFVSLSLYEGFGLTLLEAIKYKCPVVCSDIPVFREVYGGACMYTQSSNIYKIKIDIEKFLKSSLSSNQYNSNRKKILNKYNWKNCALETAKIYHRLINEKK